MAAAALDDGRAWAKFQRICEAQGGLRAPPKAAFKRALTAHRSGILTEIDNRRISRLAKLAGAPDDKAAGLEMHVRLGGSLVAGQSLATVHAEAPGQLAYAFEYAVLNVDMFGIEA